MTMFDAARIERLITGATGSLNPASLWLTLASAPDRKAPTHFDADAAERVQQWARNEATSWPAPIKIADHLAKVSEDMLVFFPRAEDDQARQHYCALHADGSCLAAVQIGNLEQASDASGAVWAIGEGAIAWLSITLAQFAAGWASEIQVLGPASVDLRILSSAAPVDHTPVQLWNFASGENAPASDARTLPAPGQQVVDLSICRSAQVTLTARSLLLPLLAQFGQAESRHIDADGMLTTTNFASHAPLIAAWAERSGLVYR